MLTFIFCAIYLNIESTRAYLPLEIVSSSPWDSVYSKLVLYFLSAIHPLLSSRIFSYPILAYLLVLSRGPKHVCPAPLLAHSCLPSVMLAFVRLPASPSRRHLLPCLNQEASDARDRAAQHPRVPSPPRGVCPPRLSPAISSSSLALNKWPSLTQAVRDRCYVKRGNWTQRCYSFLN